LNKIKLILVITLPLIFILVMCYAYFVEPYNIKVSKIEIHSPKFSLNFPGVKIVHISDLHINRMSDYEIKVADTINRLEPDIILLTGDYFSNLKILETTQLDTMRKEIKHILNFITSLHAEYGIFVSRGNYDFSNDKEISDLFIQALENKGINTLTNLGIRLKINNEPLYICGVDFPGFPKSEVADFRVSTINENKVLQSSFSKKNSCSHFFNIKNALVWKDYIYTGRMRLTETEKSGIGITFYSQFYRGYDKYYRLRQAGNGGTFHFSPHGTTISGDTFDTGFGPDKNTWIRFKIECKTLNDYTEMRAKVWTDFSPEPKEWSALAVDSSLARLKTGTVGVWSAGSAKFQFDDLLVVSETGDTLLYEDFQKTATETNPQNWVAYNYGYEAIPVLMQDVDPALFTILLSHTPDYVLTAQKYDIDLVLSGHTHGGQIRLPVIGPIFCNITLGRKYMQGLHDFNNTTLYVTRGIGTVFFPLRLFCSPEITLIHLLPESSNEKNDK